MATRIKADARGWANIWLLISVVNTFPATYYTESNRYRVTSLFGSLSYLLHLYEDLKTLIRSAACKKIIIDLLFINLIILINTLIALLFYLDARSVNYFIVFCLCLCIYQLYNFSLYIRLNTDFSIQTMLIQCSSEFPFQQLPFTLSRWGIILDIWPLGMGRYTC